MSAHLENELIGMLGRLERLEERQGQQQVINGVFAAYVPSDEAEPVSREEFNRLLKIVETQQGQIEEIMEMLGEMGAG
jgi:hypothetical protein